MTVYEDGPIVLSKSESQQVNPALRRAASSSSSGYMCVKVLKSASLDVSTDREVKNTRTQVVPDDYL